MLARRIRYNGIIHSVDLDTLEMKNFSPRLGCALKILGGIANHEVLALCHPDEKAG